MKKYHPDQMDLFAPMNPPAPTPPPDAAPRASTTATPPAPAPVPAPPDDPPAGETPDDLSFNPADWDQQAEPAATLPAAPATEEPVPESPPEEEQPADFDPFESDPFFNPRESTSRTQPATTPSTSAEELLLNRIITDQGSTTSPSDQLTRDVQAAVAARQQAEAALAEARHDVDTLQARCATLAAERDAARAEADKERQLRADAAAARSRQPVAPLSPFPADRQAGRRSAEGDKVQRSTLQFVMLGALVLCLMAYLLGRRHAPATVAIVNAEPVPPATLQETPPPAAPAEPATAPAWPALDGKAYRVSGGDDARTVVFQYGVFTRGATLSPAAEQDLTRIAAAFKPVAAAFRIDVEGHTDNTPVRSVHAFSDNQELGMARATAAAEFLINQCGLPADAITASSAGDSRPPHPGATPEAQRRNRTVVLKITRR